MLKIVHHSLDVFGFPFALQCINLPANINFLFYEHLCHLGILVLSSEPVQVDWLSVCGQQALKHHEHGVPNRLAASVVKLVSRIQLVRWVIGLIAIIYFQTSGEILCRGVVVLSTVHPQYINTLYGIRGGGDLWMRRNIQKVNNR